MLATLCCWCIKKCRIQCTKLSFQRYMENFVLPLYTKENFNISFKSCLFSLACCHLCCKLPQLDVKQALVSCNTPDILFHTCLRMFGLMNFPCLDLWRAKMYIKKHEFGLKRYVIYIRNIYIYIYRNIKMNYWREK